MKVFTETVTCDRGHPDPLRCECARFIISKYPPRVAEFKAGPTIFVRQNPKVRTVV